MDTGETIAIANTLAEYQRCFTREELLTFTYIDEENYHIITKTIEADSRFIWTSEETAEESIFIARKALYHWYVRLNVRLARCRESRLSDRQLALLMSSLRLNGKWASPPTEYVKFGQLFSLVKPALSPNEYVFPFAHIVSSLPSSDIEIARDILDTFNKTPWLELPSQQMVLTLIEDILKTITTRERYVVARREGLFGNTQMTLDQIGGRLKVTRERIRQIELKLWRRLRHPTRNRKFLAPLLFDIMRREGSLLIQSEPMRHVTMFLTKCKDIPISTFPHTNIAILGATKEDMIIPEYIWKLALDPNEIASHLQTSGRPLLDAKDLRVLAEKIALFVRKKLTMSQKVYLALKSIGRPAHYSEVADAYYDIFPEPSSEHNIHAVLLREDNGVVWIGTKGTFALEEWGYERPLKTIFDTVTEIVEQRYVKTGKPVPFNVIVAEIGKYRKVIQPSSVVFASHCNPKLERVSGDCFVPKTDAEEEKDISKDELDRILGEFERRTKAKKWLTQ